MDSQRDRKLLKRYRSKCFDIVINVYDDYTLEIDGGEESYFWRIKDSDLYYVDVCVCVINSFTFQDISKWNYWCPIHEFHYGEEFKKLLIRTDRELKANKLINEILTAKS